VVPPPIPASAAFTLTVDTQSAGRFSVTDSIYSENTSYRWRGWTRSCGS